MLIFQRFIDFFDGGEYRSRTDHQSFADSCLTAWLRRHIKFYVLIKTIGAGNGNRTRNLTLARLCFTTKLYLHFCSLLYLIIFKSN